MSGSREILSQKIEFTKGVGSARAELLNSELGVSTVEDLLDIFPFRYDDRTEFSLIRDARSGENVQLQGTLISLEKVKGKRGHRLNGLFKDSSGLLELTWFQGAKWIEDSLQLNRDYVIYGKISIYGAKKNMSHPEMELADKAKTLSSLLPVYSSTEKLNARGLSQRVRRNIVRSILSQMSSDDLPENLNQNILSRLKLITRWQAFQWIHFPDNHEQLILAGNRLKFEELFFLQLRLLQLKKLREKKFKGFVFEKVGQHFNQFYSDKLSFELTDAQKRVIREIRQDLGRGIQMNRLLQGDVGSGKTIVALMSMLIALDNGYQACLLAPTEILAQQHYQSIRDQSRGLGIQVAFLSGSVKGKTRAELLSFLKEGHINILIGTHALLEDPVQFKNLGLAVTDEQHRFGVVQRSKLWLKNETTPPHILIMTATPIPRTLAMTVYGDLDSSVIDELPPGRKAIQTLHRTESSRMRVIKFMKEEISQGRQIYIVYPLIEESAKLDLQNLQEGYEELRNHFPAEQYQIAVVHGRMKSQDKDLEMSRFAKGKAQIMVATTVIEVGVNVPNATVMIIENAARFGLSQLHQLRGRVGRGADQSYCILMTKTGLNATARERIKTMCRTNNGFEIAEVDMKLRGPGDMEGTQQSGVSELKLANLSADRHILLTARNLAIELLDRDPELLMPENKALRDHLLKLQSKNRHWGRIS